VIGHTVTDRCAWQAGTLDDHRAWYHRPSDRLLSALDVAIGEYRQAPQAITEVRITGGPLADCAADLKPALHDLEDGRGFVILEGLPLERYSAQEQTLAYWLIGQLLGRPFKQNVQGTLLYDVRDTGQDLTAGARFSVTNYESSFHTDNSFGTDTLDYVGLLCLHTAKAGGRSQQVSGYAVHNELLARHPDVLETLYQPFHIDRRGGIRTGEAPTIQFPVIRSDGCELLFRYLRYWIEVGHEKAGQPLTAAQNTALNVLDEVLNRPDLRAEFDLKPGDMYFINNCWILHNRTAFEDHPEVNRRRHLVRLWLRAGSVGA
jgi:alpha-ketoglutarate-dependent taurine dioxygenase